MNPKQNKPSIITRGESPPLEHGPQRLHYQFSTLLPQTQLTFASVLQGVAFGLLLLHIPLPPDNISWTSILHFVSVNQYLYLPYIISSLLIIFIWIQFVHASLLMIWPLSIFQATLIFFLTITEVLAFQKINSGSPPLYSPTLSPWLFGIGWVAIVGGFIRIHNLRWYYQERLASDEPVLPDDLISNFRRYLASIKDLASTKSIMQKQERRDGLIYIFAGILTILISLTYGQLVHLFSFFPWIILTIVLVSLGVCILLYTRYRQGLLKKIAQGSDLKVLPHGSIDYANDISSEESSKRIVGTTVGQDKESPDH